MSAKEKEMSSYLADKIAVQEGVRSHFKRSGRRSLRVFLLSLHE